MKKFIKFCFFRSFLFFFLSKKKNKKDHKKNQNYSNFEFEKIPRFKNRGIFSLIKTFSVGRKERISFII